MALIPTTPTFVLPLCIDREKKMPKELRDNETLLTSPSNLLNREDSTIVRRAHTAGLVTKPLKHYMSGANGTLSDENLDTR